MDNANLDDFSRLIVGYGVFNEATTENAIKVLKEAIQNYGKPESILTDRGTQFYASAGKKAKGISRFEMFLLDNGIKHIVASKPSSNEWKDREVLWDFGSKSKVF